MKEVYQIKLTGRRVMSGGFITQFSEEVYINPPLEKDIQKFMHSCSVFNNKTVPMLLDTIEPSIIKLTVIQ